MKRIIALICLVWLAMPGLAQVTLEIKNRDGTIMEGQVGVRTHQVLTLGGQELETKVNQTAHIRIVNGQRNAEGRLKQTTSNTRLVSKMEFPGGIKMEFDSRAPETKAPLAQLEPLLDGLRAALKIRVVSEFDKADHLKEVVVLDAEELANNPMMKELANPKNVLSRFRQDLKRLPDKAVSKGDSWVRDELIFLGNGQTVEFRVDYTYAGVVKSEGRVLDRINGKITSAQYDQKAEAAGPLKVKDSELKPVKSAIEVLFDKQLGQIVKVKSMVQIKGDMTFEVNGRELPGKLDLTMENNMALGLTKDK